jgi:hypothetical protein
LIGRSASTYLMQRRTDNDNDNARSVAQESARNGGLRSSWCRGPAPTGRKWYAAWEQKDWGPVDSLLADNFTFSSAAGDDHISKSAFKEQCWKTQINFIKHFDLERVSTGPDDAFVKYLCHTTNGKSFQNVEYLRIKNGKLQSIECYFGAESSFPSAVSAGQK